MTTTSRPTSTSTPPPTPTSTPTSVRLVVTDVLVLTALVMVATSPFHAAYGGWRWALAAGGGLLVGLGVALVSARTRSGPWLTALSTFVVYLVLGTALALPEQAVAGVLPTPGSLRDLLTGVVHAWRDSLTLTAPLGSAETVLLVPHLVGLLGGLVAGLVLWRSPRPQVAGLVPVAVFVTAAAFGDHDTGATLLRGLLLCVGLLVWTRWRANRDVRVAWPRRLVLTTLVVAVAGSIGTGATLLTAGEHREVLRDHVEPPFDPLDHPSPLSRFRAYQDEAGLADSTMFRTTGLAKGDLVRIATMDTFDGIVWNVAGGADAPTQSGSFGRLSPRPEAGNDHEVSITIEDYTGPWVPTVGLTRAFEVTRDGRSDDTTRSRALYNDATGTMAQVGGVERGLTYRFHTERPPVPSSPEKLDTVDSALPASPSEVPALAKRSRDWLAETGGPSGGAAAQALTDEFRKGFYSDGKTGHAPSLAGHGVKRLTDLVTPEQMVGNAEQYAAAMGVAAQSRGLPARVVMGFKVSDSSGVVRGKDVNAWVEVHLEDAGWVAFEPTPDKDRTPRNQEQDPEPEPQPHVLQPPVVPEEPEDRDRKAPQGAGADLDRDVLDTLRTLVAHLGKAAGVAALTSPVWLLVLLKLLRRRRRRRAGDPVTRLSGGWREVADRARDLGVRLPASNTRSENGRALEQRFPDAGATLLATRADAHVFGPATPDDAEVAAYWDDVDTALIRMRRSVPWWRRPWAALSPASLPWRATAVKVSTRTRSAARSVAHSRPARVVANSARRPWAALLRKVKR